jgi:hypothetical protein
MNETKRYHFQWCLIVRCFFAYLLWTWNISGIHAQECIPDTTAPFISITSPAAGGQHHNAEAPLIDLSGEVSDDRGVMRVAWSNERGGTGNAQATISDWTGPWYWEADDIPLAEGDNLITVTAWDAAGNSEAASLTVSYSTPPVSSVRNLENRKAKFTFFFLLDGIDRFSIYTYLAKDADETFTMPFDKDVTVTIKVPDPRDPAIDIQLFSQTIPAGTVSPLEKYRYRSGPGGIRELLFQESTATQTYMYVYVEDVDLLPGIKSTLPKDDYWTFIKNIDSYTITVQVDEMIWTGQASLIPGYYSVHKQELIQNR